MSSGSWTGRRGGGGGARVVFSAGMGGVSWGCRPRVPVTRFERHEAGCETSATGSGTPGENNRLSRPGDRVPRHEFAGRGEEGSCGGIFLREVLLDGAAEEFGSVGIKVHHCPVQHLNQRDWKPGTNEHAVAPGVSAAFHRFSICHLREVKLSLNPLSNSFCNFLKAVLNNTNARRT